MGNFGWKGTFKEFLNMDNFEIVNLLCRHIFGQSAEEAKIRPVEESTIPQINAWIDCVQYLKKEISLVQDIEGYLVFEYEILRSSGRRPDVLLFLPGELLVLEFKSYNQIDEAESTQTSLYVRDLEQYHSSVQRHYLRVRGALVLTNFADSQVIRGIDKSQIYLLGQKGVSTLVRRISKQVVNGPMPVEDFLDGSYQPLPSIIESARAIMREEQLPQIKSLKSSNFELVVNEVKSIVAHAKENNTHHLVLISGVPGAGKTFVGLTLAHDIDSAVYLSGNGPLVDVLQDSLKNKAFVQALHGYRNDFLKHNKVPKDQVIIFDEAQRAWDSKQMKEKLRTEKSEPEVIIDIAKKKQWSVVIGLVGEGQEIHLGEEGGISLWNDAIKNKNIQVHAKHHQTAFPNALNYFENEKLHLDTSLRTHNALKYFKWVESLVKGDFECCRILAEQLKKERYTIKFVTSIDEAKAYVKKLYEGTDKTYGFVISSGMKYPRELKVVPFSDRNTFPKNHVAYFNYPESEYYCTKLEYAATEFHVQGLELDMAIVNWGSDLQWKNGEWKSSKLKRGVDNPHQMKLNAYRVLLTRGRDGTIILCDEEFKRFIEG